MNNLKTGKQTKITPNNKLLRHEKKVSYIDYYYEPALNIKAENIYDDSNYLPNKSLISCIEAKDEVIFGIILGSEDFYYCNNSYLDMRRILDKCISGWRFVINFKLEQKHFYWWHWIHFRNTRSLFDWCDYEIFKPIVY